MKTPRLIPILLLFVPVAALADAVTEWNTRANAWVTESRMGTPPAVRLMALVQTAVLDAVAGVERGRGERAHSALPAASADAAVAAANRVVLSRALAAQQASIDEAYRGALARIDDAQAREAGVAAGEAAAAAVLAARADDGGARPDTHRPVTAPGVYVHTAPLAATQWPQRKPWLIGRAAQFRPAAPPALASQVWARDFNEIRLDGARASTRRSAEQTEAARFWDFSLPAVYHGVVQSFVAARPRDLLAHARLFAAVAQGMDDALIAVMDAKYHYQFWRPVTAIRNGDIDGNEETGRDAAWLPLIDTPAHPEYPCAHCILAATVATIVAAEPGAAGVTLATSSPTAGGRTRRWATPEALLREVAEARIHGGVHFRNSTEVGLAMGQRIGALYAERLLAD